MDVTLLVRENVNSPSLNCSEIEFSMVEPLLNGNRNIFVVGSVKILYDRK